MRFPDWLKMSVSCCHRHNHKLSPKNIQCDTYKCWNFRMRSMFLLKIPDFIPTRMAGDVLGLIKNTWFCRQKQLSSSLLINFQRFHSSKFWNTVVPRQKIASGITLTNAETQSWAAATGSTAVSPLTPSHHKHVILMLYGIYLRNSIMVHRPVTKRICTIWAQRRRMKALSWLCKYSLKNNSSSRSTYLIFFTFNHITWSSYANAAAHFDAVVIRPCFLGSAAEKPPHSMMLPPSCFTLIMVNLLWCDG